MQAGSPDPEWERQLGLNSRNSSKPPLSDSLLVEPKWFPITQIRGNRRPIPIDCTIPLSANRFTNRIAVWVSAPVGMVDQFSVADIA
ncbi:DUF6444 domain-containing protein [Nocardia sp. CA-107356]|uniref:DUF6444 domain-containing protein n=1 Tax=Nocardia sp. CA-107356 TaxID=3239972 RepID=UPI003D921FBB